MELWNNLFITIIILILGLNTPKLFISHHLAKKKLNLFMHILHVPLGFRTETSLASHMGYSTSLSKSMLVSLSTSAITIFRSHLM